MHEFCRSTHAHSPTLSLFPSSVVHRAHAATVPRRVCLVGPNVAVDAGKTLGFFTLWLRIPSCCCCFFSFLSSISALTTTPHARSRAHHGVFPSISYVLLSAAPLLLPRIYIYLYYSFSFCALPRVRFYYMYTTAEILELGGVRRARVPPLREEFSREA